MKPSRTRKPLRAVLTAALLGGLLFGGISWAVVRDINQSHNEGDIIVLFPLLLMIGGTKLQAWFSDQSHDLAARLAVITLNGLIGAFVFAVAAAVVIALWRVGMKTGHDKIET